MLADSLRGWLLLLAVASAPGATPPGHLDFDAPGMPEFLAGCGGALDDWEAVRGLDDPRDGSIRSLGVATDSCLRIAGRSLRDGVVSARIVPEEGPAGFAVRYRGPGDYLEIAVDLGAGVAVARQHSDGQRQSLGTTRFTPASPGPHAVMAVSLIHI